MTESEARGALAAALVGNETTYRSLLQSVVVTARAIFQARASSIFMFDEAEDELVFEAVCGEGEESLIGKRFSSSTGIAGWVLVTKQPLVIEDVAEDPRFAKELAEGTGYVPHGLLAAPLLSGERAVGVLEVLDRQAAFTLADLDLLSLFAGQAALALDLMQRGRRAHALVSDGRDDLTVLARLAAGLDALEADDDQAPRRLLEALADVLKPR